MKMTEINRRKFLMGAGIGALGLVGASALVACSPDQTSGDDTPAGTDTAGEGSAPNQAWRTPPAEITSFVQEYDFDAVCIGHGYAGLCACRELAESGKRVALIEVQPEETYMAMGNESCAINSKVLDRLTAYNPVPHVDPAEYFDNWMTMIGNQGNPALLMKFCQNMGDASDWYYDRLTDDDFATLTHTGWPSAGETWDHILPNIGPIKFWPGTFSCYGECNQTKIQGYNREAAKDAGAEFFFETRGYYVIKEGDKVAGLVAKQGEDYVKFNCKAVVVATGGFSYDNEMLADLMPDLHNALVGDEGFNKPAEPGAFSLANPNANGDGVKMAHWAGAHLETLAVPGMNAKHIQPPAGMTNLPQAVWVRGNGRRFCNEFFPIVEQRGVPNVYMDREPVHCVFDNDFTTYRSYYVPQHGGMEPTPGAVEGLRADMDKAYAKFQGTWVEPEPDEDAGASMGPMMAIDYIADDTLEGLAGQLGLTGEAVQNFVAQIERYNHYCEQGTDEEFGRYKEVLFPVQNGPFYAASGNPGLGELMCTMGGIITDAEQNALDKGFKPIPGLYVSGNDCGRRFGIEYVTPTPGVSLGIALTLGRECGKSVAKFLDSAGTNS
ncbi:MAG: FAD-binding protein [Coriobacteriales bacterium]|jgi:succinate dehydrogenase/fumarate reductase flavoprotein subunit|nr:FAD-binding protein [Coriobacteriales bacterium]